MANTANNFNLKVNKNDDLTSCSLFVCERLIQCNESHIVIKTSDQDPSDELFGTGAVVAMTGLTAARIRMWGEALWSNDPAANGHQPPLIYP